MLEAPVGQILPPEGSLSDHAQIVWDELAPQAVAMGTLKAPDVHLFAAHCNLIAMIHLAHRAGAPAPAAQYAEARKQAELFGLAGERSRVIGGLAKLPPKENPFLKHKRGEPPER